MNTVREKNCIYDSTFRLMCFNTYNFYKNINIFFIIISTLIVCLFFDASSKIWADAGKSEVYRPRLSDTEFVIKGKNGFLTSYGRISGDPIIDYISLEEESKSQVEFANLKWKYGWNGGKLGILKGEILSKNKFSRDAQWLVMPHLVGDSQIVFKSDAEDGLSFVSEGKMLNEWTQLFSWQSKTSENEEDKILDIKWTRKGEEIAPLKVTIAFPRNSVRSAFLLLKDKISKLDDNKSLKIVKDAKIVVPVVKEGSTLEISFSCDGMVRLSGRRGIDTLLGGWTLEFAPEDSETIQEFSCRIIDKEYRKFEVNGLEIAPNMDSGRYSVFCGGMPLFQIFGKEGEKTQDVDGMWGTKCIRKNLNGYIKSSGKIITGWSTVFKTNGKNADFRFAADQDADKHGVIIKIPYSWVGTRFQIKRKIDAGNATTGVVPPYGDDNSGKPQYKMEKQFNDSLLRIGMCEDLGNFAEGTTLQWFPAESEEVSFEFGQNCRIIAGRYLENNYSNPFDVTFPTCENWKNIIKEYQRHDAIETQPDAFLYISPLKNELSVKCGYKQVEGNSFNLPTGLADVADGVVRYEKTDNRLIVKSPYWQITHDGDNGWVPAEIIFPFGLGRNILKSPIEGYLVDDKGEIYPESNSSGCNIDVQKMGSNKIKVVVNGIIGKPGIPFMTEYVYDKGGIKRTFSLDFNKAPAVLKTVGVVKIETDPVLDYAKYKPCSVRYAKAIFPGPPITEGNRITLGVMGLYRQNGEGIDFCPSSDLWRWYILGEKNGYFAIKGNNANPVIVAEAFHSEKARKIGRALTYSHYIGLPEVKKTTPRHQRPAVLSNAEWITDNVLSVFSDAGVNVAVLMPGNIAFGCYDDKCREDVISVAKQCREKSIRFLPFFGPSAFVKQAKQAMDNIADWSMGRQINGTSEPLWALPYLICCYESHGMCDFMKHGYLSQMREIPNDGIYCDFIYPMGPCYNKLHGNGVPHLAMDGLLDFSEWIKNDLLKNDQMFFGHTGYCPVYPVEQYCDLAWIWEEMNTWYSNEGRPVSLSRVSDCGVQTSNIQRVLDPHVMFSWIRPAGRVQPFAEDQNAIITRMALNGLFPILHCGELSPVSEKDLLEKAKPALKLFKGFKDINLSGCHFYDWKHQNVVNTDDPYVKAAVYLKKKNLVVILAVPEDNRQHEFTWKVSEDFLKKSGMDGKLTVRNTIDGESKDVASSVLGKSGIAECIEGFSFKILTITGCDK